MNADSCLKLLSALKRLSDAPLEFITCLPIKLSSTCVDITTGLKETVPNNEVITLSVIEFCKDILDLRITIWEFVQSLCA